MPNGIDFQAFFASLLVVFFAIGIHEFAHCWFADAAGDPTPRAQGRVTLNLFKHFDPVGAFMIVFTSLSGFGIGWGKPAPMNPTKMDNPRRDFFIAVAAGPLSNVVQATIFGLVLRLLGASGALSSLPQFAVLVLFLGVLINIGLFLFNLIPLGPLDGQWLVGLLLPEPTRTSWFQFNRQIGGFLFLGIVLIPQFLGFSLIGMLIFKPAQVLFELITGMRFPGGP